MLQAGEGITDITPPFGVELAGFHKPPGKERKGLAVRQPITARALALRHGKGQAAIIVLEILGFSAEFANRLRKIASRETRIPADNIRICATHTHSAPTLVYLRQWGAISKEYEAQVENQAVEALKLALKDQAPADLYLGNERVVGGNHNRTTKKWRTEQEFTAESNDQERWLDTTLHVLFFQRENHAGVFYGITFPPTPFVIPTNKSALTGPALSKRRPRNVTALSLPSSRDIVAM